VVFLFFEVLSHQFMVYNRKFETQIIKMIDSLQLNVPVWQKDAHPPRGVHKASIFLRNEDLVGCSSFAAS
jgi:hypothetical protein